MLLTSTKTGGAGVFCMKIDVSLEMVCGAGNNLICCGGRSLLLYLLVETVIGKKDTVKRCRHNI